MAHAESLGGLLNGIAQRVYYKDGGMTDELLRAEFYPEMPRDEFTALREKMRGLLKSIAAADMDHPQLEAFLTAQTRRQGAGGVSTDQAAALTRFWKSQRGRVRESLLAESRWEPSLRGLTWRVDLQTAASRGGATPGGPVALMELELGRTGQDSEFVCLEFDEGNVNQVLQKMSDIQQSIDGLVRSTESF